MQTSLLASVLSGMVFVGAIVLTLFLADKWLERLEESLLDALDDFLGPILEAHRKHLTRRARRIEVRKKGGGS